MSRKKERKVDNIKPVLRKALEEYAPNVMKDSEEAYELKQSLGQLSEVDRIVILLYAELRSFTQLSLILGVSRSSCYWMVKRIREELKESLRKKI